MTKAALSVGYSNFEKAINRICYYCILDYFITSGLAIQAKTEYSEIELRSTLKIQGKFNKFLSYMLFQLSLAGFIKYKDSKIIFLESVDGARSISDRIMYLTEEFPEYKEICNLFQHCITHYPQALSGRIPAISVLYPSGNIRFLEPAIEVMEGISNFGWHEIYLKKTLSKISKKRKISVIEVGGGIGRLTWHIVQNLNSENICYYFTDISRFFLAKAIETANKKNIKFMEFIQFDISKEPPLILKDTRHDFVLALNVIHATPSLIDTINNLKSLLVSGGSLLIIEYMPVPLWKNMIWGLAEGWWYFNDGIRELTPLIDKEKWEAILFQCGFKKVRFFPKQTEFLGEIPCIGIIATL